MTRPISDLDVPLAVVEAQTANVATLAEAAAHSHSPSDRLAWALDQWLVTHPDVHVSTDADYPTWAAALATTNHRTPKEATR